MPRKELFMANVAALQTLVSTEKHQLLFLDEVTAWLPLASRGSSLAVPVPGHGSSSLGTRWDTALGLGSSQVCRAVHPPRATSGEKEGQAQPPALVRHGQAKGQRLKHSARWKCFLRRQGRGGVFRERLLALQWETDILTSALWGTYLVKPHEGHPPKLALDIAVVGEDSVRVH